MYVVLEGEVTISNGAETVTLGVWDSPARLVPGSTLKVYPGGPRGLAYTHKDQLNADLLAFLSA
jgi:hypothetical protein